MPLDDLDLSILKALRLDPRMSYTGIADKVGISRFTVKSRVEQMLEENLIEINVKVNIARQGGKIAVLELEVKSLEEWDECLEKLNSLPWVLMGFKSFGKSNLRVLIYGETDEILERNIDEFRYYDCVNFIEVEILGKPLIDKNLTIQSLEF